MRKTIFTALVAVILSGCAGVQWGGGKPTADPAFGVGGLADSPYLAGMRAHQAQFNPVRKNDPGEKPTVYHLEWDAGKFHVVHVYAERCLADGLGRETAAANRLVRPFEVYLCGEPATLKEEMAHLAGPNGHGMDHTDWVNTGVAMCATVTRAGYRTGFVVGSTICRAPNGHLWAEK